MSEFKSVEEFRERSGYDIDGAWYPRVTKIVEIKAKPALYRFYGRLSSFAEGERIKERSAAEGTAVHEAAEAVLLGQRPEVSPLISPSLEALKRFLEERHIVVDTRYVEHRLVNFEERYAGTLDAIAEIDGRRGILDIKTSQSIFRDYDLQTSAYLAAMRPLVPDLETRWILRIDQVKPCVRCGATLRSKGGKHQVRTVQGNLFQRTCAHEWGPAEGLIELKESPHWEEDFRAFLGAKRLWEWENAEWLKQVGYA